MEKELKLAIVNIDAACLRSLYEAMEDMASNIDCYKDPEEALLCMLKSPPDVLIMDISMPRLNGMTLCDIIRSNDILKDIPIVLISSNKDIGDFTLYFKGVDFLQKPVDTNLLLRKVKVYHTLKTAKDKLDQILESL